MAKFWNKIKNFLNPNGDSRKCMQKENGKWYCYKKVSGGRWEECIPAIAYETETDCMKNADC